MFEKSPSNECLDSHAALCLYMYIQNAHPSGGNQTNDVSGQVVYYFQHSTSVETALLLRFDVSYDITNK